MKIHTLALVVVATTIASCSDRETSNSAKTNTDSKKTLAAPTMQPTTIANTLKEPIPPKKAEKLKIDLEKRQVFIPSNGWVSTEVFWEIYHNNPEKLPGDIDFNLLQQLKDLPELEPTLANKGSDSKNESSELIISGQEEKKTHPADLSGHPAEITNNLTEGSPPPVIVIDNPAEDPIRLGHSETLSAP